MQYFTSEVISLNSRIKDLEEQLNKAKESNEILTRERDEARKAVEEISKYTILFLENTTENVYGEWNVDSFKKRINDLCKSYNYNKLIEITKKEFDLYYDWFEYQIKNIELSNAYWTGGETIPWKGPLTGD